MHWILLVGINWNIDVQMGAFESLEACTKAEKAFMEMSSDDSKAIASCVKEDDPILGLFNREKKAPTGT